MEKYVVDVLFTEILNRHQRFFISLIRDKFQGDEVHDVYQDVCLHLYEILNRHWNNQQDLFNSKAWLRTVVINFCLSELRKRNQIKRVKLVPEKDTAFQRSIFAEPDEISGIENNKHDLQGVLYDLLQLISKHDAMILKMKYYYGKPSSYISRKLNVAHVDVSIGRIKEKIQKKSGIKNIDELIAKNKW